MFSPVYGSYLEIVLLILPVFLFLLLLTNLAEATRRVLHVRNLPLDATQQELSALCAPFGRVVQVLLLNTKPQAFVEFDTADAAKRLLVYYDRNPALLHGRSIYFQYSNRESVGGKQQNEAPNTILLVTISNTIYPVTIELLYTVFCAYGPVYKIVIFSKNGAFQALVQYMEVQAAVNAKTALDGQNLYVGACTMRVQFSQLPDLTVKYNNERSRNFMDPSLPTVSSGYVPYTFTPFHHAAQSAAARPQALSKQQ